jgi:hypothetical protein
MKLKNYFSLKTFAKTKHMHEIQCVELSLRLVISGRKPLVMNDPFPVAFFCSTFNSKTSFSSMNKDATTTTAWISRNETIRTGLKLRYETRRP